MSDGTNLDAVFVAGWMRAERAVRKHQIGRRYPQEWVEDTFGVVEEYYLVKIADGRAPNRLRPIGGGEPTIESVEWGIRWLVEKRLASLWKKRSREVPAAATGTHDQTEAGRNSAYGPAQYVELKETLREAGREAIYNWAGWTYAEIATALDISESAAKVRASRGCARARAA